MSICPYAVLPDGRRYQAVTGTPDLISAFKAGTIPHVPPGVVALIEGRQRERKQPQPNSGTAGVREQAYAQAALEGAMAELAATGPGKRNEKLNAIAYRLGRMVARGWLTRAAVEGALLGAMHANGYVGEEGLAAAEATLRSGLDAGEKEPHPDLADREEAPPAPTEAAAAAASATDPGRGARHILQAGLARTTTPTSLTP